MSSNIELGFKMLSKLSLKEFPRKFFISGDFQTGKTNLIRSIYEDLLDYYNYESFGFFTG